MASEPPVPEDDRDLLAAELALGLLTGDDRRAAEARLTADPAFAEAASAWEARLAPLYDELSPVVPDPALWSRIEAELPRAANDDAPAPRPASARPWQFATAGFAAIAASLALALVLRPESVPVAPPAPPVAAAADALVAQLPDAEGASMLAARLPSGDDLVVRATAIPEGAGEPELWVIPAGGAPVSLGLIARQGESRVALDPARRALLADGATLALTLEPREGAPHSAPSGDILGTARLTRL